MSSCPHCDRPLLRAVRPQGIVFWCPACHGCSAGLAVLRKLVRAELLGDLWQRARQDGAPRGVDCPVCRRSMAQVSVYTRNGATPLDVCVSCQLVWFDAQELDELPTIVRECRPREELPDKAREQIALMQLKTLREKEQAERPSDDWPEEIWKWIPAVLGLPVEMDANPVRSWSWLTWGLAAAMAVAFALTAKNLDAAVDELGLVPNQFARHGGITFVTSFFLHGGFFHLLSNAYFLLVFGNNVEDDLGRWRYALLIVAAALGGDVLHILGDPRGMVACVGASGGISGIIAFYALRYPHARLGIMWRLWFLFRWFQMPAWAALIVWLVLQAWLAAVQLMGAGQVSALAHLGGCAVGLLAWLLWRAGKAGTD